MVLKRADGIEHELDELRKLGMVSAEDFARTDAPKLAQYHLHRALEGVFNIGSHILSRIPGAAATTYAEIARKLGEHHIVEAQFAEESLVKMAKYRNRLVHFYAEVTTEEVYDIIKNHLDDFTAFLTAVKDVLEHPESFGVAVE